ncbi:MAG: ferric reductase-like transmembrane domain-containing protein [Anaerolineales bacterium]|nr:ferric reductase-like transmembrane domain-containing protein [Anaerolineales bacterium]
MMKLIRPLKEKTKRTIRGSLWALLYILLTVGPLLTTMFIGPTLPGREFWREFSVALGFSGLALMTLQFVITARFQPVKEPFGSDIIYLFHRQISIASFLFIIAHPLILFFTDPATLQLLNLINAPWRARLAVTSVIAVTLLGVTALWRRELKIEYDTWRLSHGFLATLAVGTAFGHILLVNHYTSIPLKRVLWIVYGVFWVSLLAYTRVYKPWMELRRSYRIKEVIKERGGAWSVVLKPDGYSNLKFQPGQFAWISVHMNPFQHVEHPFSITSSAENHETLSFTIKELGDFTSTIKNLKEGEKVYVDGPHGALTIDRYPDLKGFVFIAGGVGVTPMISMLRTMADRDDQRPVLFFYANRDWESVIFREEISSLEKKLNLTMVHVLENPPENWKEEIGYITPEILDKYLPVDRGTLQYFICGPEPMMDAVENALQQLHLPPAMIRTERFSLG